MDNKNYFCIFRPSYGGFYVQHWKGDNLYDEWIYERTKDAKHGLNKMKKLYKKELQKIRKKIRETIRMKNLILSSSVA